MEIVRPLKSVQIRSALFDFDGTLSLIREGWQEVMISFMVEILRELDSDESDQELRKTVEEFVTRLTGKQTIYQMIQLVEEIEKRGGRAKTPLIYKKKYHHLLDDRIQGRLTALETGEASRQDWLIPGALELLENLSGRGVDLYLASGTDEVFVKEEAKLLGLTPYFKNHIYGAQDEYENFSKKLLIRRIFAEKDFSEREFAAFGDGYVEIENTKQVGGTAIGVASDEVRRSGVNEWKRRRLIEAGADIIVPDFKEHEELLSYLFGGTHALSEI